MTNIASTQHTTIRSSAQSSQWTVMLLATIVFAAGFGLALVLLLLIPGFVGTDDYYHSRIAAEMMTQGNLRVNFTWLPLTILNQEAFVDHHLLYHLYLAPWMVWGGITGVKIAQAAVIGGIGLACWSLLRFLQVRSASLWTLALVGVSAPFLYRMLMIRTQAAAVLLLLITLHLLFRQRYRWLVLAAFAFTWLYNGFILLPAVVGLYSVSIWVTERRFVWLPLAYALGGVALGLIINPYFPQNIAFIIDHLGEKVTIGGDVRVGSEWYPYTTGALLKNSLGALLALGVGMLAGSARKTGRDQAETTLLLIALMTLFMLMRSRRFIEYFPVFALLFCAAAWGRSSIQWQALLPAALIKKPAVHLLRIAFVIIILWLGVGVLRDVHEDIQGVKPLTYMADAAVWLADNTEPGELIFQTDWDDFTRLFYHNPQNVYLVGLDPTYLQIADPFMWNQWVAITQGNVERPSVLIRETFDARYVISDTRHDDFAQQADNDPAMSLVYRDASSMIWQVATAE